ncbi:MAG: methyltransferase domain-containing protein [Mariniphaga sp.]|nr:methyltransferase domain-containing protein [Mariniphaga sp.]
MRKNVAILINPGDNVIDIACGTGAQVFKFAKITKEVVGIDLSESMIKTAINRKNKEQIKYIEFIVADASKLSQFTDKQFDVATMSLALHQFDPNIYPEILKEIKRISNKIIFTDYSVPLSAGIKKTAVQTIEFLAGKEHNKNFRNYYKKGGLLPILKAQNLKVIKERKIISGIFNMVVCSSS